MVLERNGYYAKHAVKGVKGTQLGVYSPHNRADCDQSPTTKVSILSGIDFEQSNPVPEADHFAVATIAHRESASTFPRRSVEFHVRLGRDDRHPCLGLSNIGSEPGVLASFNQTSTGHVPSLQGTHDPRTSDTITFVLMLP